MSEPVDQDRNQAPKKAQHQASEKGKNQDQGRNQAPENDSRITRIFGSRLFFRLWLSQAVSSLGDWIGFAALTSIAARLGGSEQAAAITVVIAIRIIPSLFLGSIAGVLVDKFNRKRIMVICDVGRAGVVFCLPYVNAMWQLVIASFVIEVLTLMWSPAKEATVPNIVPHGFLARANSLSLAAAYGMFVPGLAVFAILARVADWYGSDRFLFFPATKESLALFVDAGSYLASALTISFLALPKYAVSHSAARPADSRLDGDSEGEYIERRTTKRETLSQALHEFRSGWKFVAATPVVRSVMIGLTTGLFGGAMVIPLAYDFSSEVLNGGQATYAALEAALGTGVGVGIFGLSLLLKKYPPERGFWRAVVGAGISMCAATAMFAPAPAMFFIFLLGVCAGAVYVLGFTILQTSVSDDMRGRTFSAVYVMARFSVLMSFVVSALMVQRLDDLSNKLIDGDINVWSFTFALPGVRLALWFAGGLIIVAGFVARHGLVKAWKVRVASQLQHPSAGGLDPQEPIIHPTAAEIHNEMIK